MLEWMERAGIIGEPRHARVAERGAKGRPFMAQAAQQLRVFVSHSSLDDAFCHTIVTGRCATPGAALFGLAHYQEALDAFDRALTIDPHFAAAWNNKGACLHMLERPTEAAAAEQHARELGWQV